MYRLLALLPVGFLLSGFSSCESAQTAAPSVNGSISRDEYGRLHQLGGSVDEAGFFQNPISTQDFFGEDLGTGVYRLTPEWSSDGDHTFQLETQNGYVVREGIEFYP